MILKKLVVKNGSYQKDGATKHRYLTIGHLHSGEHGEYITLESHINLAALPRRDGDTRVMVSLYDEEDSNRSRRSPSKAEPENDLNDEIPF